MGRTTGRGSQSGDGGGGLGGRESWKWDDWRQDGGVVGGRGGPVKGDEVGW